MFPMPTAECSSRVVPSSMHLIFATIGSLGDLNPILAVATEWTRRGHRSTVVSNPMHRDRVEAAGFSFHATAPAIENIDEEVYRKTFDVRHGTRVLFQEIILPAIADSYADLRQVIEAERPDGLVANDVALAVPIAADVYGLPWAAAVLQPGSFLSAYDPPVSPAAPWLRPLARLSPRAVRLAYGLLGWAARPWQEPVRRLRRTLEVSDPVSPLLRDKYAADLALALFSRCLAKPQPDWPASTVQCGFPFFDERPPASDETRSENRETRSGDRTGDLPEDLAQFLSAGPPPIVFTLGSTATQTGSAFFETSLKAAQALGERAVVVIGGEDHPLKDQSLLSTACSEERDHHVASYVSYGRLFERARAVVHAGGIGTIGLALRAGVPQLIVPHMHDQPDNAARVARTGAALTLKPADYTVDTAAAQLRRLLNGSSYADAACTLAGVVQAELGAAAASDALAAMVHSPTRVTPPG